RRRHGIRRAGPPVRPAFPARREFGQLEKLQRLAHLRQVDARLRFELAHPALGEVAKAARQRAAAPPDARAPARPGVGLARREGRAGPLAERAPAGNGRRRDADSLRDLVVTQDRRLDEAAGLHHLGVAVHVSFAETGCETRIVRRRVAAAGRVADGVAEWGIDHGWEYK